ncbi:Uncharacterised protein [Klebsiella pneumoniae]|nr:Uncharacterised protein [Klebsiella pneumoniae]
MQEVHAGAAQRHQGDAQGQRAQIKSGKTGVLF